MKGFKPPADVLPEDVLPEYKKAPPIFAELDWFANQRFVVKKGWHAFLSLLRTGTKKIILPDQFSRREHNIIARAQ